jgi:hypothetical protein
MYKTMILSSKLYKYLFNTLLFKSIYVQNNLELSSKFNYSCMHVEVSILSWTMLYEEHTPTML